MEGFRDYTNEVALNELSAADEILIWTENSEYRFSVVDPAQRHGILSGGTCGDQRCDAFFIGALTENGNDSAIDPVALKTGARALFFVNTGKGAQRILTSAIKKLSHIRGERSTPRRVKQARQTPQTTATRPL